MKIFLIYIVVLQFIIMEIASANNPVENVLNKYNGDKCSKALVSISATENLPVHLNIVEQGKLQRVREDFYEIISNTNLSDQDKSLAILGKLSSKYKKLKSLQFEDLEVFFNIDWETDKVKLESNLRSFIANNFSFLKAANRAGLYYKYINKEELDTLPGYKSEIEINHGMFLLLIRRLDPSIPLTEKQVNKILNKMPKDNLSLKDEVLLTLQDIYGEDYIRELSESGKHVVQKSKKIFKMNGATDSALALMNGAKRLNEVEWLNKDGLEGFILKEGRQYTEEDQLLFETMTRLLPQDLMVIMLTETLAGDFDDSGTYNRLKKSISKIHNKKIKDEILELMTIRMINLFSQEDYDNGSVESINNDFYKNFVMLPSKEASILLENISMMKENKFLHIKYIVKSYLESNTSFSPGKPEFYKILDNNEFYFFKFFSTLHTQRIPQLKDYDKKEQKKIFTLFDISDFLTSDEVNNNGINYFLENNYDGLSYKHKKYILKKHSDKLMPEMFKRLKQDIAKISNSININETRKKLNDFSGYLDNNRNDIHLILNKIMILPKRERLDVVSTYINIITRKNTFGFVMQAVSAICKDSANLLRSEDLDSFIINSEEWIEKKYPEDYFKLHYAMMDMLNNHDLSKEYKDKLEQLIKEKYLVDEEAHQKNELQKIRNRIDSDDFLEDYENKFYKVIELVTKLSETERKFIIDSLLDRYYERFGNNKYIRALEIVIDNVNDLKIENTDWYKQQVMKIEKKENENPEKNNIASEIEELEILNDDKMLLTFIKTHKFDVLFDVISKLEPLARVEYLFIINERAHCTYGVGTFLVFLKYFTNNSKKVLTKENVGQYFERIIKDMKASRAGIHYLKTDTVNSAFIKIVKNCNLDVQKEQELIELINKNK